MSRWSRLDSGGDGAAAPGRLPGPAPGRRRLASELGPAARILRATVDRHVDRVGHEGRVQQGEQAKDGVVRGNEEGARAGDEVLEHGLVQEDRDREACEEGEEPPVLRDRVRRGGDEHGGVQVALVHPGREEEHRAHQEQGDDEEARGVAAAEVEPGRACDDAGEEHRAERAVGEEEQPVRDGRPVRSQERVEVGGVERGVRVGAERPGVEVDDPRRGAPDGERQEQHRERRRDDEQRERSRPPAAPPEERQERHRCEQERLGLHEDRGGVDGRGAEQRALVGEGERQDDQDGEEDVHLPVDGRVVDGRRVEGHEHGEGAGARQGHARPGQPEHEARRDEVEQDRRELHQEKKARRVVPQAEEEPGVPDGLEDVDVARRVVDEHRAGVEAGQAALGRCHGPRLEAGDVGG